MEFIYPAVFEKDTDGINVSFPDLPGCLTCADDEKEAFLMACDALATYVGLDCDDEETALPAPSSIETVQVPEDGFVSLVRASYYVLDEDDRDAKKD